MINELSTSISRKPNPNLAALDHPECVSENPTASRSAAQASVADRASSAPFVPLTHTPIPNPTFRKWSSNCNLSVQLQTSNVSFAFSYPTRALIGQVASSIGFCSMARNVARGVKAYTHPIMDEGRLVPGGRNNPQQERAILALTGGNPITPADQTNIYYCHTELRPTMAAILMVRPSIDTLRPGVRTKEGGPR
jgi:hypothetical protein